MATVAELRENITNIEQRLQLLRGRINSIEDQQEAAANAGNKLFADLTARGINPEQDADYIRLRNEAAAYNNQLSNALSEFSQLRSELQAAQQDLQQEINAQTATVQRSDAAVSGSTSAGQVVREDAAANALQPAPEVIKPDGRIVAAPETVGSSNAVVPTTKDAETKDTNTDAPVRTIEETQAVTSVSSQSFPISVGDNAPATVYSQGVGNGNDDAASNKNTTQQAIDTRFNQSVTPQANLLDKYYSYTYNAELWLMRPEEYRELIQTKRINATGGMLFRSGGIPTTNSVTVSIPGGESATVQDRNPYFSLDYYIDSIEMSNLVTGKGTGAPHQSTKLKMTVIEPNGITLIENIANAVANFCGIQNYAATIYLLKIKFYGYDENGVLQKVNNSDVNTPNDPYAVVTKYVPFIIDNITFSVGNQLTTYTITGVPTGQDVATGQARGTIPYNIEVSGSTVGQVLGDDSGLTTTSATPTEQEQARQFQATTNRSVLNTILTTGGPSQNAPPKADAAVNQTSGTIVGGLMGALNEFQRKLVKDKVFTIADEYSIEFTEEAIRGARVRKVLNSAYSNTPMTNNASARSILEETQAMNPNQRIVGITAGMPIVQAIDLVIRNSEYIEKQQLAQIDESTGEQKNNPRNAKAFAWFKISMVTEQKGYDFKRNDYAYKIKFIVSFYEVKGIDSPWFPTGNFSGVHKSYPYWFTGQNTAILEYTQAFNHAYRTTLSGSNKNPPLATSDLQKIRKYWYAPRSSQSSQQGENAVTEPAANAAEFLYSQGDLGNVKIRIIGDPSWIAQGEIFHGVDPRQFSYAPFLPDGTINFDAGEILFEIIWVRNGDYDLETGLMKPNLTQKGYNQTSRQSTVYKATQVTSFFTQGRFEQQLEGILYIFPIPNTTQQAKSDVQDAKDLSLAANQNRANSNLRNPAQNTVISATNPAAVATDTVSTPESNYSSSAVGTDRFAGQVKTDAITGSNNLGAANPISAPPLLPVSAAQSPTSQGQIDTPTPGLAGVQINVNTLAAENTPEPATLPGIQVNIVPTSDRQLIVKET